MFVITEIRILDMRYHFGVSFRLEEYFGLFHILIRHSYPQSYFEFFLLGDFFFRRRAVSKTRCF